MCYLIAKKFNKPGCIAVEMQRGKHLADIVSSLGKEVFDHDVQIFTVSSMEVYGEYRPYTVLSSEKEFIEHAIAM